MKRFIWSILLLSWFVPSFAYVTDDGWKLVSKSTADTLVYTKAVDGQPIKAVKAVTVVDASMETLLMVLADADLVPEWIPVIGKAELLQHTNPDGLSITYMVTKFPWPIRNRDAVIKTVTTYERGSGAVRMESSGLSGYVEEKDGLIRTPTSYTLWKIYPLEDSKLHVEIITHSDPRGHFPNWLMNMIVKRTPKSMFSRLDKTIAAEQERGRAFDQIHVFGREVGL